MTPRTFVLAIAAFVGVLLAGCTVSVDDGGGNGEQPDATVSAEVLNGGSPTARNLSIGGNSSALVRVDLSAEARAEQAVYFELGTEQSVELVLFNSSGSALASSTSADIFRLGANASGTAATTPNAAEVEPQVATVETCQGACIITNANRSTFYLRVYNRGSTSRSLQLYVYAKSFADETELENNSELTAPGIGGGESATNSGAIEYLGDEDNWVIEEDGLLYFDALGERPADLQLRLTIVDAGGETIGTFTPGGDPIQVLTGDVATVFEEGHDAAAVSGSSQYFLEIQ